MAKQLITTVHVHGHGIYRPGDKLPTEVRKLLADNPRVWGEDDGQEEPTRPGPSETALAGDAVLAELEAARARIAELEAAGSGSGSGSEDDGDGPPPKAGPGSGASAWVEYSKSKGVDVPADARRDDVIAALEKAGFATDRPE